MHIHVIRGRSPGHYYQKIVGHSGAMSLTEKVYTHLDVQILVDAINKTSEE